ncbi:MAG: hypothetical protein Q9170_004324 [Blastenia crenularia]
MAKKRKLTPNPPIAMDLGLPRSSQPQQKSILSANTNAGISKSSKPAQLPRGKGRRAQRLRKEKAGVKAEEVKGRTEGKVDRSLGKGRRRAQRNAKWEEMNVKIKDAMVDEVGLQKGKRQGKENGGGRMQRGEDEDCVDEVEEEKLLDGDLEGKGKKPGGDTGKDWLPT